MLLQSVQKNIKCKLKPNESMPSITLPTLRHTFATRTIEQSIDIFALSKILRYSNLSTILNKYGHALPNHKKDNMKIMYLKV